jgi:hypothetical protein
MASTASPTLIAEDRRGVRRFLLGAQPDDRDVGERISPQEIGVHLLAVRERAEDLLAAPGDVVVGDDVPLGGDDRPRPERLELDLAPVVVLGPDHVNPDERGLHPLNRLLDGPSPGVEVARRRPCFLGGRKRHGGGQACGDGHHCNGAGFADQKRLHGPPFAPAGAPNRNRSGGIIKSQSRCTKTV